MSALSKSVYPASYAATIPRRPADSPSGVTSAGFQVPALRQHPYARGLLTSGLIPSFIVCIGSKTSRQTQARVQRNSQSPVGQQEVGYVHALKRGDPRKAET